MKNEIDRLASLIRYELGHMPTDPQLRPLFQALPEDTLAKLGIPQMDVNWMGKIRQCRGPFGNCLARSQDDQRPQLDKVAQIFTGK